MARYAIDLGVLRQPTGCAAFGVLSRGKDARWAKMDIARAPTSSIDLTAYTVAGFRIIPAPQSNRKRRLERHSDEPRPKNLGPDAITIPPDRSLLSGIHPLANASFLSNAPGVLCGPRAPSTQWTASASSAAWQHSPRDNPDRLRPAQHPAGDTSRRDAAAMMAARRTARSRAS